MGSPTNRAVRFPRSIDKGAGRSKAQQTLADWPTLAARPQFPAATQDQKFNNKGERSARTMIVSVRKPRTISVPMATSTNGSAISRQFTFGFWKGSPTEHAPQDSHPFRRLPSNLKPQQGQIVSR